MTRLKKNNVALEVRKNVEMARLLTAKFKRKKFVTNIRRKGKAAVIVKLDVATAYYVVKRPVLRFVVVLFFLLKLFSPHIYSTLKLSYQHVFIESRKQTPSFRIAKNNYPKSGGHDGFLPPSLFRFHLYQRLLILPPDRHTSPLHIH